MMLPNFLQSANCHIKDNVCINLSGVQDGSAAVEDVDRGRAGSGAAAQSPFARATRPSHARLGFGVRSNVVRSTAMSPKVGP